MLQKNKTDLASTIQRLEAAARQMRRDCIQMTYDAGNTGAHIGGGLSLVEIMATLYLDILQYDRTNRKEEHRDRLIFSKGHGTLALYTAMHQAGLLTKEDLATYKKDDSLLSAHPALNAEMGIEFSSGSLGHGLSLAVGSGIALKRKGNTESRIFVILGDGECDEGSVWEAAAAANHYHLDNIVAVIDNNRLQYDGAVEDVMSLSPLEDKWNSFGWQTVVVNGHSVAELDEALRTRYSKPYVIIANTIKGRGVSFMEGNPIWHNGRLTVKQYEQAMAELDV